MPRKREPVNAAQSESESVEEEANEGSSEDVESPESDSEPEQTQTATQVKSHPLPVKPQQPPPPSQNQLPSSPEEEDSGSETESDADRPNPNARPLVSNPVQEPPKSVTGAKKARSKSDAPKPVASSKPSAAKRPSEDTFTKDAKKPKKTAEMETSEKKPNLFRQRLWGEEDELTILKGVIEYSAENKSDPISDMDAFHEYIKKKLPIDISMTQLHDKIKRMKKKYVKSKVKSEQGAFANLYEQRAYDLSKEIWGNNTGKKNKKANAVEIGSVKDDSDAVDVSDEGDKSMAKKRQNPGFTGPSMEERMLLNGRDKFEVGQGLEGEEEWEKLKVEELQLYLKQLELRVAQTKLVLNALKGGVH